MADYRDSSRYYSRVRTPFPVRFGAVDKSV